MANFYSEFGDVRRADSPAGANLQFVPQPLAEIPLSHPLPLVCNEGEAVPGLQPKKLSSIKIK